jgi:hypothetical protein
MTEKKLVVFLACSIMVHAQEHSIEELFCNNTVNFRLNMELDLQTLFGLHEHSSTNWPRSQKFRNPPPPPPPRIWAHIRGRYWSARTDDISLCPPPVNVIVIFVKQ